MKYAPNQIVALTRDVFVSDGLGRPRLKFGEKGERVRVLRMDEAFYVVRSLSHHTEFLLDEMAIEASPGATAVVETTSLKRAKKVGGSYQAKGTVVSTFRTLAGEERFVFEFDDPKGMLHIFGPNQLEIEEQPVEKSTEEQMISRYEYLMAFLKTKGVLTDTRYVNGTWVLNGIYGVDNSGLNGAGRTPEEAIDNAILMSKMNPEKAETHRRQIHRDIEIAKTRKKYE